jgi:transposase
VELLSGRERRRRWSVMEKLRIVAETHEPGARISGVAARHGVCVRIPTKPAIDSDANQPPVPIEASQAFRRKPAGVAGWSEGGIIRLLSLWSRQA